jgi:Co/Zn/Cd efflux system component
MDDPVVKEIRDVVETPSAPDATRLADLHVWRVGKRSFAAALTVVTRERALGPDDIRRRLAAHPEIVHATVEVQYCE